MAEGSSDAPRLDQGKQQSRGQGRRYEGGSAKRGSDRRSYSRDGKRWGDSNRGRHGGSSGGNRKGGGRRYNDRFDGDDRYNINDRGDSRGRRDDSNRRRDWRGSRDSDRRDWRGSRDGDRRDRRDGDRDRRYTDHNDRGGYRTRNDRNDNGGERRQGGYRKASNDRPRRDNDQRKSSQRRRDNDRPNFRTTHGPRRQGSRSKEPQIPSDIDWKDLDDSVIQDLRSLSRDNSERVGCHLVAAAEFMLEDPKRALQHAKAAKERASRVAVVRETLGIAAYHAEDWKLALSELRTARRMTGTAGMVAVIADCERALGKPEKAISIASEEGANLALSDRVELAIVVSGARRDLNQLDEALLSLEEFGLEQKVPAFTAARLHYAYADLLEEAGRGEEAVTWFERVVAEDHDEVLDARDRIVALNEAAAESKKAEQEPTQNSDSTATGESTNDDSQASQQ